MFVHNEYITLRCLLSKINPVQIIHFFSHMRPVLILFSLPLLG